MSGFGARREHRVIAAQLSLTVKITKGSDLAGTKRTKSLNSPLDEVSPSLFISRRQPTIVFTHAQLKTQTRR
jgi:hypothetical protein